MSFKNFLKAKLYTIIIFIFAICLITLLLLGFKITKDLIIYLLSIITISFILSILIEYIRKCSFYNNLLNNIDRLDKAYLVLETLTKPNFYEGELLYNALYEINKSMAENVKILSIQNQDFKEYIELWIHEVKIPISSLVLIAHNHPDKFDKKTLEQIRRIEDYVEQVLYYVRSENASVDYLINKVSLNKVIGAVALKNKNDLLENKIDLIVSNTNSSVYTDSKWLEFILNQIINNSIKYHDKKDSYIKIYTEEKEDTLNLIIKDNGIGIKSSDLPRIFDKTFTGANGHTRTKSTGMGLFIAKNLCLKLGHKISIESKVNEYTIVTITFSKNKFYEVAK